MNFGQGKVSEKSGNFISDKEWAPCLVWYISTSEVSVTCSFINSRGHTGLEST